MDERFLWWTVARRSGAESRYAGDLEVLNYNNDKQQQRRRRPVTRAGGSNYAKEKVGSANGQVGVLGTSSSTYIFVALYCATNYVLSRSYARETFPRRGDTDELNYNSHC